MKSPVRCVRHLSRCMPKLEKRRNCKVISAGQVACRGSEQSKTVLPTPDLPWQSEQLFYKHNDLPLLHRFIKFQPRVPLFIQSRNVRTWGCYERLKRLFTISTVQF